MVKELFSDLDNLDNPRKEAYDQAKIFLSEIDFKGRYNKKLWIEIEKDYKAYFILETFKDLMFTVGIGFILATPGPWKIF